METGAERHTHSSTQENHDLVDSPTSSAPLSPPSTTRDIFGILAFVTLVVSIALLLAWPWLPPNDPQIVARNQYQPLSHGQSASRVTLDANGTPLAWTSENLTSIPAWETFGGQLPLPIVTQLLANLPSLGSAGQFPPATSLFHSRVRNVDAQGEATSSDSYILRQPDRDEILAIKLPTIDAPLLYDPPLDLTVNHPLSATTIQSGTFAGVYSYTLTLEQSPIGDLSTPLANWQDCQQIAVDYALFSPDGLVGRDLTTSSYCAGRGLVAQFTTDADGNPSSAAYSIQELFQNITSTISALLPPALPLIETSQAFQPSEEWQLTHVFSSQLDGVAATSIAPVYVPAQKPFILSATRSGPLLALDAQQPNTVLWQFQPEGSIYSQPIIDPATGIIYFGSSDKHLYALTSDGLFLWRTATDDNIAAQPLLVDNRVIVAAESGTLTALDKITGKVEWNFTEDSALVAAPTTLSTPQGQLVVVGSDAGIVSVRDVSTGSMIWQTELDGAIHFPLHGDRDSLYVTTTTTIYALASDGKILWLTPLLAAPTSAPIFDNQQLYLIDTMGWLYAVTLANGEIAWRSEQPAYVGQPIRVKVADENDSTQTELLVVLSSNGIVDALSPQGELVQQWQISDSDSTNPSQPTFSLGFASGGGALWFADDQANLYRLGPPIVTP